MIISTKTYTSHVSILLSSVSDKTAAKSAELSRKSFFWTLRRLFAMYFFLAICFVYPVAIPEPFAHSRGIRLLATHSLAQEALMRDTGSLLVCYKLTLHLYENGISDFLSQFLKFRVKVHNKEVCKVA